MTIDGLNQADAFIYMAVIGFAYLLRGITGFGSALVSVPLLAIYLPLHIVVPVIALLDYFAALVHSVRERQNIAWNEVIRLTPAIVAGSVSAIYLLNNIDTENMKKVLGGLLLLYTVHLVQQRPMQREGGKAWAFPFGLAGGSVGAMVGTGGPFYVIYLQLRAHGQLVFRATVAVALLIDGMIRIAGYMWTGMMDETTLFIAIAALPLMLGSMCLGSYLEQHVSLRIFRKLIAILLTGSGLTLIFG